MIGRLGKSDYGDWKAGGAAFEKGPVSGDILTNLKIENAGNEEVLSSEIDGDGPTGRLTSPEFKIARAFVSFGIGGGDYERHACMDLIIAGKVVKSATGRNSDCLSPASWNVLEFMGKTAQIQIVGEVRASCRKQGPHSRQKLEPAFWEESLDCAEFHQDGLSLAADSGEVTIRQLTNYRLKSSWF